MFNKVINSIFKWEMLHFRNGLKKHSIRLDRQPFVTRGTLFRECLMGTVCRFGDLCSFSESLNRRTFWWFLVFW